LGYFYGFKGKGDPFYEITFSQVLENIMALDLLIF
jgi:hypothetical protein